MKRVFFLFILSIYALNVRACVCSIKDDYKSQEDLEEYQFIALVKINEIGSSQNNSSQHLIKVSILKQFKGKGSDEILVYGGHPSLTTWTSCDLNENVGEEWLVFASKVDKGSVVTGLCTRTIKYKSKTGYRFHLSSPNESPLEKIKNVYGKPQNVSRIEGLKETFYQNGVRELLEYYTGGLLDGSRVHYYSDGSVNQIQNYKLGKKHGQFINYSFSGVMMGRENYNNDKLVGTSTFWEETKTNYYIYKDFAEKHKISLKEAKERYSKSHINSQIMYGQKGRKIYHVTYSDEGRLVSETFYNSKEEEITNSYFPNGQLALRKEVSKNGIMNKNWDKKGALLFYQKFDHKGRLMASFSMN